MSNRDTFSHGLGAALKWLAGWQKRMLISAVLMTVLGMGSAVLTNVLVVPRADQAAAWWRTQARLKSLVGHPFTSPTVVMHWEGRAYVQGYQQVLASSEMRGRALRFWLLTFAGWFPGAWFSRRLTSRVVAWIEHMGAGLTDDAHRRGSVVQSESELAQKAQALATERREKAPLVHLGGVPIPRHLEPRNFLLAGTVGAGKTTAIRQVLDTAEERKEAVVLYDPSGDLVAAYYNPARGDVILNPYDARAAMWDPVAEIVDYTDAKLLASSLAQAAPGGRPDEWLEFTRGLVADVIWELKKQGRATTEELLRLLGMSERDEVEKLVAGTPSARLFEPSAERATASVFFNLPGTVHTLASLRRVAGPGGTFSWRNWADELDESATKPWVFLGAPERQFPVVRPLITGWLNCAAANLLSLPRGIDRRVWMVIDEFPSLPRMEVIPRLAAQGRKYGVSLVIGIQSPSQLEEEYGRPGAATLTATAGTQLILRLPGGEAARWASTQLGQQEVERNQRSEAYEIDETGDRSSVTASREVRSLALDTEIAELRDLEGYLRVPGVGVGKVAIPTAHLQRPARAPSLERVANEELWNYQLPQAAPSSVVEAPPEPELEEAADVEEFRLI